MSLTVKAYFPAQSENPEIRRFALEQDVASNFEYFDKKVRQVFPGIGSKPVTYHYKDEDDDNIAFSSDDELIVALGSIEGEIFKVYITTSDAPKEEEKEESGVLHPSVVCDNCDGAVYGTRFKCVTCADYDLCSKCEKTGAHSHHQMWRIAQPRQGPAFMGGFPMHPPHGNHTGPMPPWGVFGFAGMQRPDGSPGGMPPGPQPPMPPGWPGCPPPPPGVMPHGFPPGPPPFPGNMPPGFPPGMFPPNVRRCMRRWMKEQQQQQQKATGNQEKKDDEKMDGENEKKDEEKMEGEENDESGTYNFGADYLQNVGASVAAMLDPLGIDVDIDIEHNGRRQHVSATSRGKCGKGKGKKDGKGKKKQAAEDAAKSDGGKDQGDEETGEQEKMETEITEIIDEASEETPVIEQVSPSPSPTDLDWTVIDPVRATPPAGTTATATPAAAPSAPVAPATPSPEPETPPQHPDPKIAEALAQMQAMGFRDDAGWLTSLLVAKEGDIARVIDAIHPSRHQ